MSYLLYRALSGVFWVAALPWAAVKSALGSREWSERMGVLPEQTGASIWVHAASVGEVAAVAPLVRSLAREAASVVMTVVTPTGHRFATGLFQDDVPVVFAPLDFVPSVRRVLSTMRPRLLLLTETELWPNTIVEATAAGAAVGVVNGRLSAASARRYAMAGSPFSGLAGRLRLVAARSDLDADRFLELGVDPSRVSAVGDMKFDKLERPLEATVRRELRSSLGISETAKVAVFGSVRAKEERQVAGAIATLAGSFPDFVAVVAPRHMDRVAGVEASLETVGVSGVRRASAVRAGEGAVRVVVLDSTGELARVYAVGDVAFVGGTLAEYGGHDPLEPAAQGVPVVLGPHTESCRDSSERLLSRRGAVTVGDATGLAAAVSSLLSDDRARHEAGQRALEAVDSGRGATERTMELIRSMGVFDDPD